jgi:hypothetical protein
MPCGVRSMISFKVIYQFLKLLNMNTNGMCKISFESSLLQWELDHDRFLPHAFQFIIYLSSFH